MTISKLDEASRRYAELDSASREVFLKHLIYQLSIAARLGYSDDLLSDSVLRYLKGINEMLHVSSQNLLRVRLPESKGSETDGFLARLVCSFEMYATPEEEMPFSALSIIYRAFKEQMAEEELLRRPMPPDLE